ncbi:dihydrolipoamide acetyltransferase family protein [Sinomonas sp. ASV322]|uniref:dihydrolipoamide acetyltransferase family protein n=1 Tax=Sinomonas sp. ASV322 TaxID=3041920 RepID=UPI0027DDBD0E|nr:dihydrolipoamide acetyltransferase family protein [Sinomonas sp. ASV322]MDQ4501663.1 dihydrolipoamide acetyltransferase family protein [Sinomonas sp. ASV322]
MTREFLLPDLGEGLTEAELVRWLVAVGDSVAVDQPVVEVETAKAIVEVPSPFAGVVAVLHGQPGETLDVGRPLISIAEVGSPAAEVGSGGAEVGALAAEVGSGGAEVGSPAARAYRTEERAGTTAPQAAAASGSGNVLIGYGTSGSATGGRTRRRKGLVSASGGAPSATAEASAPVEAIRVVSPLVRKAARELGVSLHSLRGSGPDGLIMRRDVEHAAQAPISAAGAAISAAGAAISAAGAPISAARAPISAAGAAISAAGAPISAAVDAVTGLGIASRVPIRGVRKAVAQAMTRSRAEIPEATVWVDADATELVELRADLKRRDPENTPSLLAFIARFVVAGLAKFPELNTRIETAADGGQEIVAFDGVNLGFAAQTERGLVVPSIRGAHGLSARALDAELRRLTAVARDGKATPADLSGSTFTLNNYGVFGVDGSAAIINYPEAAILGVGRIVDRPWAVDGALAVRKVVELTLVFDHRVCDGGTAGGFLRYVADAIEHPGSILADL